jgi:hypothetical protein
MQSFDCVDLFYYQRRRHSTRGQISPAAFEHRSAGSSYQGYSSSASMGARGGRELAPLDQGVFRNEFLSKVLRNMNVGARAQLADRLKACADEAMGWRRAQGPRTVGRVWRATRSV